MGHALGEHHLLPDGGIGGAAADREVVALHHHPATLDPTAAHDHVGRREVGQLAVLVAAHPGQSARLVKRAGVEQALDPLAHREPPAGVLPGHALGSAHPAGQSLATAELLELWLPGHRQEDMRTRAALPPTRGAGGVPYGRRPPARRGAGLRALRYAAALVRPTAESR